jgi:hypothetical protein
MKHTIYTFWKDIPLYILVVKIVYQRDTGKSVPYILGKLGKLEQPRVAALLWIWGVFARTHIFFFSEGARGSPLCISCCTQAYLLRRHSSTNVSRYTCCTYVTQICLLDNQTYWLTTFWGTVSKWLDKSLEIIKLPKGATKTTWEGSIWSHGVLGPMSYGVQDWW